MCRDAETMEPSTREEEDWLVRMVDGTSLIDSVLPSTITLFSFVFVLPFALYLSTSPSTPDMPLNYSHLFAFAPQSTSRSLLELYHHPHFKPITLTFPISASWTILLPRYGPQLFQSNIESTLFCTLLPETNHRPPTPRLEAVASM
jgi:hypothetical protein